MPNLGRYYDLEVLDPEMTIERAADALGEIAHPDRLDILLALKSNYYHGLSYSELLEATNFENSGRFDYHLKQLTGRFVKKEDNKYELRSAGNEIVLLVQRGDLTPQMKTEEVPIERYCQDCNSQIKAWYENGRVLAWCHHCPTEVMHNEVPPRTAATGDIGTILDVVSLLTMARMSMSVRGHCPNCGCRKERAIVLDHYWDRFDYPAVTNCKCGYSTYAAVGMMILTKAPVISFLAERGIDAFEPRWWRFPWTYHEKYATLVNEDPTRVRVDIEAERDVLEVTVSNEFQIVDTAVT
jgi:hypothetical protein